MSTFDRRDAYTVSFRQGNVCHALSYSDARRVRPDLGLSMLD